ncbi:MAG: alpha/beta hydrolase [Pseudomonadota bacterium]
MKTSESVTVSIRGVEYHCRVWGEPENPTLFFLHGFQDVSASWQFTVDALTRDWYVIAPDWRGYGLSGWSGHDTYWSPDLVADLDALLDHFEPEAPATLIGHSMGGNTAAVYAGAIPGRIHKFVNVEGIGGPPSMPDETPRRYARWLQQIARGEQQRPYESFVDFADRMMAENSNLTAERAQFLVQHWGREEPDGTVVRRADPAQALIRPLGMRTDEMLACWRRITAPVLWVEGSDSRHIANLIGQPEGYEDRLMALQTLAGVERIDGAGHNVHHDQPEKLAEAIERFLAS